MRGGVLAAGAVAVALLVPLGAVRLLGAAAGPPLDLAGLTCPTTDTRVDPAGLRLSTEQRGHAATIIGVGARMGVPVRGRVIAIATALQESGLRNLDHGDRDSVGLFQQRPSQGWGTREQIMTPAYAAEKFYRGLLKIRGWQSMRVTDAAQAVQRSGFPEAYEKHAPRAVAIVAASSTEAGGGGVEQAAVTAESSGCTPVSVPISATTSGTVRAALAQVGKPYVWGATGPDSFDCSGLIVYAWERTGWRLTVRTSQAMHGVAVPVPAGQERPGDLIFSQFGEAGPGHVMMVVRPGLAVEAPRTGLDVRTRKYSAAGEGLRVGRLPESAMTRITAPA
ncbi:MULTISPECIES: C40 family peptidase [Streptomyces]|uniref:C40 family peptidase n=1 Tax=Streptomyces TaxID=1883 RepID=UPI000282FDD6|nr:NlpC/P60 family protein [Streptomyces sp. SM8]PKA32926.1 peptidoglycan endopeptidase [Streptomyces sp. SM8]WSD44265.1 C40 family peptidase [Streptomyces albidoflavus]